MSLVAKSKKRGASYLEEESAASTPQQQQMRKKRTPLSKKKKHISPFELKVHQMKNAAFEALNKKFQTWAANQRISDIPNNDPEHPEYSVVPQAVEAYLAAAYMINQRFGTDTGTVVSWGSNDTHQLGWVQPEGDDTTDTYLPTIVESLRTQKIKQVRCGGVHGVALSVAGTPWTWGANDDFACGREDQNDAPPKPVTGFMSFDGKNEDGTILKVTAGASFSLYLTVEGNVYTTGMYKEKDSAKFKMPSNATESITEAHNKTPQQIEFPSKVKDIFSGENFAVAILDDGHDTLLTWGLGQVGEMARSRDVPGAWNDSTETYNIAPELYKINGKVNESIIREHFLKPKPVRFNWGSAKKSIVHVACGQSHLLVVAREPGAMETNVYASGHNGYHQTNIKEVNAIHELTLIKQFEGENIIQVAGGRHFSMALSMDRKRLFAWGRGENGQLGLGPKSGLGHGTSLKGRGEVNPRIVPFPTLNKGDPPILIQEIVAGEEHALAITAENDLYSWGFEGTTGHKGMEGDDVLRPTLLDFSVKLKRQAKCFGVSGGANSTLSILKLYGARPSALPEKDDENRMAA